MTVSPSHLGATVKIRAIAAAAAALVILAACGGSETSKPETRTKNGALIQQTIPQNTNTPQTNIIDNSNNNATTTQPNTVNKTCAQGGLCVVGDTGPGGGIVFYAEKTLQPWGQYMEVSQKPLDPNFDTMWCDVAPTQAFPKADALGNGLNTTTFYARDCKRGLLRLATDLVQGGYDDWSLPTLADAKQLYLARDITKIDGQWHYTATPNLTDGKQEAWAVYMVEEQTMSMNPLAGLAGRAIRTFAPLKVPSCANGDACKVGDVGPGGGLVFYAADTPQPWGQYMEVSQTTLDPRFDMMWCDTAPKQGFPKSDALGNGLDTTTFFARDCTRGLLRMAVDLVQGGKDDWSLPTIADLKQLYLVSKQLRIEGQWHYSATPELNTNQPLAQYMVDGTVKSMNPLAGFAGRAIRTFGPRDNAAVVVAAAPTTFPAPSLPQPTNPAPTPITTPPTSTTTPATTTPTTTVVKPAVTTTAAPVPTSGAKATTTSVSAPKATTTSVPVKTVSCATGNTCKVGDTGPGGGIVFYAARTPQPWGQYLEASPRNIANTPWCPNRGGYTSAAVEAVMKQFGVDGSKMTGALTGLGDGRLNTAYHAIACTQTGAVKVADSYVWGGLDDWYLPSRDELIEMFRMRSILRLSNYPTVSPAERIVSSSDFSGTPYVWGLDFGRGGVTFVKKVDNPNPWLRPIRAFGPTGPASVIGSATISGNACKDGGPCNVGDIGPGGGIVFYASPTRQTWGQYVEMATTDAPMTTGSNPVLAMPWCTASRTSLIADDLSIGAGPSNTRALADSCGGTTSKAYIGSNIGKVALASTAGRKSDWYIPTSFEANYMMSFSQSRSNQATLGKYLLPQIVGRCYWTSNDIRPNQPVFMQMTVGLAVATNNSQTCATRLVRAF